MANDSKLVPLAKRALRELRTLTEAVRAGFLGIQKQIGSIHDQQEAADQQRKQENQRPQILNAELQIPEAAQRQKSTSDDRQFAVQLALTIITFFAFAAAAIYAGIAAKQLHQMKIATEKAGISAEAAKSAADTAQRELVQANRPWLGADHLIFTAPVRIVKNGPPDLYMLQALMSYKYEIRNYGKDPALKVHYHAESIEFRLGEGRGVDAAQDMSCQWADGELFKDVDIGNGAAIFTNDFLDATDDAPGILFPPPEIFGSKVPDAANGKFFIAGCVSYVDQFFDVTKKIHHTRFCFISDTPLGGSALIYRCWGVATLRAQKWLGA